MNFTVERTIQVPYLDEARRFKIENYWLDHGFDFTEFSQENFRGSRGGIIKNLFALESSKLWSYLDIVWLRSAGRLDCKMRVNYVFHDLTEWDRIFLNLEMATFESYMLNDDKKVRLWNDFMDQYRSAFGRWAFSFGICGRKVPPELRKRIDREM